MVQNKFSGCCEISFENNNNNNYTTTEKSHCQKCCDTVSRGNSEVFIGWHDIDDNIDRDEQKKFAALRRSSSSSSKQTFLALPVELLSDVFKSIKTWSNNGEILKQKCIQCCYAQLFTHLQTKGTTLLNFGKYALKIAALSVVAYNFCGQLFAKRKFFIILILTMAEKYEAVLKIAFDAADAADFDAASAKEDADRFAASSKVVADQLAASAKEKADRVAAVAREIADREIADRAAETKEIADRAAEASKVVADQLAASAKENADKEAERKLKEIAEKLALAKNISYDEAYNKIRDHLAKRKRAPSPVPSTSKKAKYESVQSGPVASTSQSVPLEPVKSEGHGGEHGADLATNEGELQEGPLKKIEAMFKKRDL